ncbi:MAG: HAEPLYID family protein [Bacteroidota bacterium]
MKKFLRTITCRFAACVLAAVIFNPGNVFCSNLHGKKSPQDSAETRDDIEKVEHAEPLYSDLVRDLGTLEGEMEFNAGFGVNDEHYEGMFEFEFAPIDHLGVEFEVPFNIHAPGEENVSLTHRIEAFKAGLQWSFFVSEEIQTSMAVGYSNELLFHMPESESEDFLKGNAYNPFIVAAKRWSEKLHSLGMAGAEFTQDFASGEWHTAYKLNTSFQYMFSGSQNFVGVELNKVFEKDDFGMDIRPQANFAFTEHLMLGVMVGIPVSSENRRVSTFFRLMYEIE